MTSPLWFICGLILFVSSFNAEHSKAPTHFVLVGEPIAISCQGADYNRTWYRNGSDTPITTETHTRIHQRDNLLWFIPATLEDSGFYECNKRKSNSSIKNYIELNVFENNDGLCFNGEITYKQKVFMSIGETGGKITCPDLEYFKDENNTAPEIQWYKECKPGLLDNHRFHSPKNENSLTIKNATIHDKGNYTCQTTYIYMGKQHNVSRTINVDIEEGPKNTPPEIIYPKNHSIEVKLGSHVIMDCNISSSIGSVTPYWQVNDMDVNEFDASYQEEFYEKSSQGSGFIIGTRFNISKVKRKDYFHKFVCHVLHPYGEAGAYVVLKYPAPNTQGYLIGGLVSLVFVIVVAVFVYKLFKIDIVLWYRNYCHHFLSKEVSDGKIYDAYVLYPKNRVSCLYSPDIFALKILPEVLERQCGYNLFIFGRDDLPGQAVINVADEKISQSRRVIIVLVPDSSCYSVLEDSSEQQLAVYNAIIRDGIKVILIELDKIKDYTNMPESIKYIKQKQGVIKWKGDFTERSHSARTTFWKNVRYQMPPRQTLSPSELRLLPPTFNSPHTITLER
nr:interleukin-1 receptor type 1 [Pelodiscus sinensis]XP_006133235.1 interleukin-1 receptor type 1 [Pelodiscus sinensis]XP_006133236.1 interleukin-1 receptor type 1 [Pelodiscus sinensis]XP_025045496.1 interleukin-1 receptor type 1 [Pelodiscus sinensis]XP_025045497.1 interleukin-1 receptor type 1 [Pelodiscus sinensis]|eukprot:XP_006133233.1 interleukin-1 receptor type 1 [Pelodiscus sinensis]